MPHPGNKRLRSARNSHTVKTQRVQTNINEINRLQAGGQHTLGNRDANKNGSITIASNDKKNKELVLGDGKIIGTSQSFSIRPDPVNAFDMTLGADGAAGGGPELIKFQIQPEIGADKDMLQADLNAFKISDIISISGFSDQATAAVGGAAIDESWINGTYRLMEFTEKVNATQAMAANTAVNAITVGNTRTGIVVERLAVTHTALDRSNAGLLRTKTVPALDGHSPVIKKHFRISIFTDTNGDDHFYV